MSLTLRERFAIRGRLTTLSPLHIGSGQTTTRPGLIYSDGKAEGKLVQVSAVATDHRGKPYIPGSSLKGRLRAVLRSRVDTAIMESIFGVEDQGGKQAHAGRVEFWDSFWMTGPDTGVEYLPFWDDERLTGVASAVAIARKTRTAAQNKLMHREFVPPTVTFAVEITGQGLSDETIAVILHGLDQLALGGSGVGADSGDGQGCLNWQLVELCRLRQTDLAAWLALAEPPIGYSGLPKLKNEEVQSIKRRVVSLASAGVPASIQIPIQLCFRGSFLVNDPSQTQQCTKRSGDPSFAPLRDHRGLVLLPARSIRGALRSQAERILRTLSPGSIQHQGDEQACGTIYEARDKDKLCLLCQLFGAPGWRAPVSITDFTLDQAKEGCQSGTIRQQFLAIDRFTGGGADGLKFQGESAYKPILTGALSLATSEPWMRGLLCLLLRDLKEGDITLGFGGSKGYGDCNANFEWKALGTADECRAWVAAFRKKMVETTNQMLNEQR